MIYGFVCFGKEELTSKFLFDLIFLLVLYGNILVFM